MLVDHVIGAREINADLFVFSFDDNRGVPANAVAKGLPKSEQRRGVDYLYGPVSFVVFRGRTHPIRDGLVVLREVIWQRMGNLLVVDARANASLVEGNFTMLT